MLLPGLAFFIVFKYFPMYGVIIAFKDYDLLEGIAASPWADPWYKHFEYFYRSTYFSQLLMNTFLISLYKIVFGMAPDIVMALLLNECRKAWFKRSVQTLTYMPHFLSWVIIYGIALAFLSETTGILNRMIQSIGLDAVPFLSSTDWFRSVLVGSEIWKDIGWGAIIYLAAMSAIDPALYEAARVDGASRFRMMRHITLPGIAHVFVLLLILRLGHILDAGFEQVYIMYNIRVYPVADIIDTWVYRTGLERLNFSLAAAVGLFKSFIGLWLVLGANALAKRWGQGVW
ncbi:sugar ABC transporter ATPase [Paenibacillus agaridevorans]|uniref:Sugar ABC transporter ATPase n=1 Tax=Paenibacillus agaridevorans TaxID=171404 RepID=A0A2R5F5D9_9BACL|nr:ABC transporter permease subunit [Paenibacillus agaridevorans]GBG11484.1 sugar ABC transporter ATPase [Paenibacillus agaridevorans]